MNKIAVRQQSGDIVGNDNVMLQRSVDEMAARGGGVVEIGPGTYTMHDSLHLRSDITLRGAGHETILCKAPMVESPLANYEAYGHYDISVAEPDKFRVGMGVCISGNNARGFLRTVATLTWRKGDRFGLSRMLNCDYFPTNGGVVQSLFPVISGCSVENGSVEHLVADGNASETKHIDGCRGGAVYFMQASQVAVRDVTAENYNGDGICIGQSRDVLIEDCVSQNHTGLGFHPGSGSVRVTVRRVRAAGNGGDGVYFCVRVTYSLVEDSIIENNGGDGISIGDRDTDNLIRNNIIRHNGRHGVYFRDCEFAWAGHRCQIEGNTVEGRIVIDGATTDIHLLRNRSTAGVVVGPRTARIVVSEVTPDKPLAVGPSAAPPDADRHLRPL